MGRFEVVSLASASIVIYVRPAKGTLLFFQHEQNTLTGSLFLLCEDLFIRLRLKAVFLEQGGLSKRSVSRLG